MIYVNFKIFWGEIMIGIYRVPMSLIFKNPLSEVESKATVWSIIKTVFGLKKCKYKDLTALVKKSKS